MRQTIRCIRDKKDTSLAAMIKKAKEAKQRKKFEKYVQDALHLWFYQYVENFHCKPDSVEDMTWGLRYLIYCRSDR